MLENKLTRFYLLYLLILVVLLILSVYFSTQKNNYIIENKIKTGNID